MAFYNVGSKNQCPHCLTGVRFINHKNREANSKYIYQTDGNEAILTEVAVCPECDRPILSVKIGEISGFNSHGQPLELSVKQEFVAWPRQGHRPIPKEVRDESPDIAEDYSEAVMTLSISPKASAALSRRCLQSILREKANAQQHNLANQIDATIPNLPSYISENIDHIRNIGNFAAHPIKSTNSGEIVDVETGEAEWNLDVIDQLFDFYYVQPALAKEKRDRLNKKLGDVGKPLMKS